LYLQQKTSNKPAPADTKLENSPVETSNSSENTDKVWGNSPQMFQQQQEKPQKQANFHQNGQSNKLLEIQQEKPNSKLEVQRLKLEQLENSPQQLAQKKLEILEIGGDYLLNPNVGAVELLKQANFQLDEEQLKIVENMKFQNYQGIMAAIKSTQSKISTYKSRGVDTRNLQNELNRLTALKDAYTANQLKPNKKNKGGAND
jgi:hypothetical protein